ncbi:hypothetical protein, conserved [Plasmodium gonderi]|uniref:Protein kinase domain-containing protein n=1 Tax=Plasmodium gonderi TaxID=77519 RepID=A0A1Y1JKA0_PLAGO|nr:hypothetical protein, conserved [Plasmodium gonderi]GAW82710.1 hypothetical protein, conserved [Plasmodium gonderi]
MHFLNYPFDKRKTKLVFRSKIEEKLNEYKNNGTIITLDTKCELGACQIKLSSEFINSCSEQLLIDILKIKKKLKVSYGVKYSIIYSILLKGDKKKSMRHYKNINPKKNVYKIVRKNTLYFLNQYLILKCIYRGIHVNIYKCKNVLDNKKFCLKVFHLMICLKENCPYYVNGEVYLTNYLYKILNEIFFLNYLDNQSIIQIEKVYFDQKKKMLFTLLPYVTYQSMYYKKRHRIYSAFNKKVQKLDNKYVETHLYSEKFLKLLFLNIYNTLNYLLKKSVTYLDLKPDNILLTSRHKEQISSYLIPVKKKKQSKASASGNCVELPKVQISIQKKLNELLQKKRKREQNTDLHDKEQYNKKIFLRQKENKKTDKSTKNRGKKPYSYCHYKKLTPNIVKNKKIKYIYNMNLSKCFEYDKNVKKIFFEKNKLSDIFFSSKDAVVYVQTFIKREKAKSVPLCYDQKKNPAHKKKETKITSNNTNKLLINNFQINKIKNLSTFKHNSKNSINFLKFYWLYFNEENSGKWSGALLPYLDIYFVHKYFCKTMCTIFHSLNLNTDQNNITNSTSQVLKEQLNSDNIYDENILKNETPKKNKLCTQEKQGLSFLENEESLHNIIKLIDFDACTLILKNFNIYTPTTDIFNSFEGLLNQSNEDIHHLSKKLSYNFGSVLYTFVFGKTPFHGKNIFKIYSNMKRNKLIFPKYRRIDKNLRHLLKKLLKNNPNKRMQFKKIKRHTWFSKVESTVIS